MAKKNRTGRELLTGIGIGNFNATMIIQYLFVAPATTDPRSSPIIIMVEHIQRLLNVMGAGIPISGYLDTPTAKALDDVLGQGWERVSWGENIGGLLDAYESGYSAEPPETLAPMPAPQAMSGPLDFLPDVPGGLLTYAVGGYLAYRYFAKRH
jgi:hypothetical protein